MCHQSVLRFVEEGLTLQHIAGQRVLEVGSCDVNGSPRAHVTSLGPASYRGVDLMRGSGVDEVCDACDLLDRFGPESFDVVVSTEMLEHAADWRGAVGAMAAVLAEGGLLCLTARGPGFGHHNPPDHWRYSVGDFRAIFGAWRILQLRSDEQAPGVFLLARKRGDLAPGRLAAIHVEPAPRL